MQTNKGLNPAADSGGGRPGSAKGDMLVLLHELLLPYEISEGRLCTYRVSHGRKGFMKPFSFFVKAIMIQFKSAAVVFLPVPHLSPQNLTTFDLTYQVCADERVSRELFKRRRRIRCVARRVGTARPLIDRSPCLHQGLRRAFRHCHLQKIRAVLLIRRFDVGQIRLADSGP
jgi:hypothetical protein